jgi:CRP-like cAMP-binding protein
VSEQGKEAIIAILEPGHFFGEGCLNGQPHRYCCARRTRSCECGKSWRRNSSIGSSTAFN